MIEFEGMPIEGNEEIINILGQYTNTIIAAIGEYNDEKIIVTRVFDDTTDEEKYVVAFYKDGVLDINFAFVDNDNIMSFMNDKYEYSINLGCVIPTVSIIENTTNNIRQLYSIKNPYDSNCHYLCYYHGLSNGRSIDKTLQSLVLQYQIYATYDNAKLSARFLNKHIPYKVIVTNPRCGINFSKNYVCVNERDGLYGYGLFQIGDEQKVVFSRSNPLTKDKIFEKIRRQGFDPNIPQELSSLYLNEHPLVKKLEMITREYKKQIFR